MYLPPPVQYSMFEHFIAKFNSVSEINKSHNILIGDFNLNGIDWSVVNNTNDSLRRLSMTTNSKVNQTLIDFVHDNNFKQFNSILNIKTKVLVLVLTEYSQCRVEEATHNLVKMDPYHPPLEIALQYKLDNNLNYKDQITWLNFGRANYSIIKHELNKIIWHEVFHGHDNPNDILKLFYDAVNQGIKQCVPSTTVQSSSHPPWFSKACEVVS